jgi:hypothetical protein
MINLFIIVCIFEVLAVCILAIIALQHMEEIRDSKKRYAKLERSWAYWKCKYLALKKRVK